MCLSLRTVAWNHPRLPLLDPPRRGTLLLMLLTACGPCLAAQATDQPEAEAPLVTSDVARVDTTHERVSGLVEDMARRIDRFFANERAFEEENDTSLQISLDLISEENSVIQFNSRVRGKLSLPGTERRLRLVLESDPRELDPDAPRGNPADALDKPSDYILGLEGQHLAGRWEIRPSAGIRVRWTPDPYARLRAIRYFRLDDWLARVSGTAAWFSSDGTILDTTLDFDRRLGDDLLFRSASNVRWEVDPSLSSLSQVFSLFQRLASKASLAYDIGLTADDETDWRTTDYFAQLRYRRLFYRNWAYLELQPRIGWPEDNNFHEDLSLLVRLELNFGRGYRQGAGNTSGSPTDGAPVYGQAGSLTK